MVANYPWDGYGDMGMQSRGKNSTQDDDTFVHLASTYAQAHAFMAQSKVGTCRHQPHCSHSGPSSSSIVEPTRSAPCCTLRYALAAGQQRWRQNATWRERLSTGRSCRAHSRSELQSPQP